MIPNLSSYRELWCSAAWTLPIVNHLSWQEPLSWNQFQNWKRLFFFLVFCEILLVTDLVHSYWGTLFWASVRLILFPSLSLCVGSCWWILCFFTNTDTVCAAQPAAHRLCASCKQCTYYVHLNIRRLDSHLSSAFIFYLCSSHFSLMRLFLGCHFSDPWIVILGGW